MLAMFEALGAAFGPELHVLVNSAGTVATTTTPDTSLEEWERVFAVNARGTFLCCKYGIGRMRPPHAAIVNVASVAGMVGVPNRAAYCASKGAVIAFSRAMAIDHVSEGIRVNCVCPGTIDSPWIERLVADGASRDDLVARQPIGRLGTPDEVAEAILYLASDQAGFSTGSVARRRRRHDRGPEVDAAEKTLGVLDALQAGEGSRLGASRSGRGCRSRPSTASCGGSSSAATRAPRATASTCSGRGSSRWRAGCSTSSTPARRAAPSCATCTPTSATRSTSRCCWATRPSTSRSSSTPTCPTRPPRAWGCGSRCTAPRSARRCSPPCRPRRPPSLLGRGKLARRTEKTLVTMTAPARGARAGARAAFAIDDEENERNIRCVGSAVLDHRGRPAGAVSVTALTVELSYDDALALGPRVVAAAQALSEALGAARRLDSLGSRRACATGIAG